MRIKLKIYKTTLLIIVVTAVFLPVHSNAQGSVQQTALITRSYPLTSSDRISLSNKFGEMKLVTWERPEIRIKVTIITKAATEDRAVQLIRGITIESEKNNGGINCITKINDDAIANSRVSKIEEYTINYEVYLPAGNPLSVINKYGATVIPDYKGEAEIVSQHGKLMTGRISNAKKIVVEFGKGEIFHINNGHLLIRYSQVEINKLSGNITAEFEFADSVRISMDNDIQSMNIRNTYSMLYLDLAGSFSARFRINSQLNGVITAGALKMEEELLSSRDTVGKNAINHRYIVTVGKGERNILIDSKFGKVILGQYYVYKKSTNTTTTTESRKTKKKTTKFN